MRGRELPLLPARRRHAPVGSVERHEERRVHHAQAQDLLGVGREFRVEAHVAAARAVEELAVKEHARLREHVLEKERFAPADVGEDHVRVEALALELQCTGGHLLAALDRLQGRRAEAVFVLLFRMGVRQQLHARDARLAQDVGLLADADYDIALLCCVVRGQVPILAGKVLMDEEKLHTGSRMARRR